MQDLEGPVRELQELIQTKRRGQNDALKRYAAELRASLPPRSNQAECEFCRGAGLVVRDVQPAHPDFERLIDCPVCGAERRARRLAEYCQLPEEMRSFRFAGYWSEKHGVRPLLAVQTVLEDRGWATLAGPNGLGKTFLLAAAVNEARERGLPAVYTTMANLLNVLRREIKAGDDVRYDTARKRLWECTILAVDEIDRYNETQWAESMLFELADHRYCTWRTQGTLWATNNFDRLPDYFQDRMSDGRFQFVEMAGESVRPELERDEE